MAGLSGDDLKFVLKIDPDVKAVNDALAQMGRNIDQTGKDKSSSFFKNLFTGTKDAGNLLLSSLLGSPGISGQIGGLLGGAVGGPGGAIIGGGLGRAAGAIPGAVGGAAALPVSLTTGALNQFAGALRAIQGPLGPIGAGLGILQSGLTGISNIIKSIPLLGSVLGPLSDALAGIPGLIGGLTSSLLQMSQKASPGVFFTWTRALEDAQATIGERFVPVVEIMRDVVNLFSDSLGKILPNMTEVRGALGEFRSMLADAGSEIRSVLNEVGPSIREFFIDSLKQLSHWLAVATRSVTLLAERLRIYFGANARISGATGPEDERMRTFAARPATFTNVEQFERSFQAGAFMIGSAKRDPQQDIADMTADLVQIDQESRDLLAAIDSGWQSIEKGVGQVVSITGEVVAGVRSVATWAKAIYDRLPELKPNETVERIGDRVADVISGLGAEGGRSARLNAGREQMKRLHPEYFSTGTNH